MNVCEISKNIFFIEHLQATASELMRKLFHFFPATCIPLVVRGLDLAANKECPLTGTWSKDDLHVMLTVMENELEQVRSLQTNAQLITCLKLAVIFNNTMHS